MQVVQNIGTDLHNASTLEKRADMEPSFLKFYKLPAMFF